MASSMRYSPGLSVRLSLTLDDIGLNWKTVQRRREMILREEVLYTIKSKLILDANITTFFFGSQSEGTTTPGLQSDKDALLLNEEINVINDWAHWQQGKVNLMMLHEDTAPGYCRLQLLQSDIPLPAVTLPDEGFIVDIHGRVMFTNYTVSPNQVESVMHGPAVTCIYGDNESLDNVHAFKCRDWSAFADTWASRHRRGHWPTEQLLQHAFTDGIFVVPVGYKLSHTQGLEWRISFSLTERRLMFSMNMIQIKCYVVLKMLIKTFISPHVEDSISSYHCKTALFFCVKDTEREYWREDNLVECIVMCLTKLLTWVSKDFCPHFIILESNLFAGKITPQNKLQVQRILKEMIDDIGSVLLCIPIDNLGDILQLRLSTLPVRIPFSPATTRVMWRSEDCYMRLIQVFQKQILLEFASQDTNMLIPLAYRSIRTMLTYRARFNELHQYAELVILTFVRFLSFSLGSLLTSVSLSCQRGIPCKATAWLSLGVKIDIASLLKLASIFYCSQDLQKSERILAEVEERYRRQRIQSVCQCYDHVFCYDAEFAEQLITINNENERAALVTDCVQFFPQERHCVPPELRHEFYRSCDDDLSKRDPIQDRWMVLAVADCLPYLYYLQYITYGQMGKRDQQNGALVCIERCLLKVNNYGHLETGWNLLGQCMEQEKKPEEAMRCYRRSLDIKPRNNAANSHVQNLRYQAIRNN